jgi:hypothetical protein
LLSTPKMQPHYDKVTWLFTSRNFKDDAKDREAGRTHDRFGVTSWPTLVLFDPRTDQVLAEMPRTLEPWLAKLEPLQKAVPAAGADDQRMLELLAKARALLGKQDDMAAEVAELVAKGSDGAGANLAARALLRTLRGDSRSLAERLQDPDVHERALALEMLADDKEAKVEAWLAPVSARLLDAKEHIIVRLRALAWLTKVAPQTVSDHAEELLAVPNDAFRNGVLVQVSKHPSPKLAPLLSRMFTEAGGKVESRNPNVLRMHVAGCFAGSGDASAIDAVAPLVRRADPRNGTTKAAAVGLAGLTSRVPPADQRRIIDLLLEGMPPALPADADETDVRLTTALVGEMHKALATASGKELPQPPKTWTADDRDCCLQALRRVVVR